ncbi:hypothetical protein KKH39_01565 [Patescibacteria group bacterium]|nr:hypothetical protein [Patescibacteria group bacterium]
MPIFDTSHTNLKKIKESAFKNEREIQSTTEKNLNEIFSLDFIKSEVALNGLRIDSLAFDNELKAFVIIEYKKDRNFSVIDQGYAYLSLLLNNKADFILEYNESKNQSLKREDVDWSQSRVIFISPEFTKYQKQAINFKDLPIELWEISKFENNTILYNQLQSPESSESINKISSKSDVVEKVSREIKIYSEEKHLESLPEEVKNKYEEIKEKILNISDNITVRPRKYYIGFIADTNFVDFELKKSKIKIWINLKKGQLNDPKGIAKDVSNIGHWGNGDYEIVITPKDETSYILTLIEQSYKKHTA